MNCCVCARVMLQIKYILYIYNNMMNHVSVILRIYWLIILWSLSTNSVVPDKLYMCKRYLNTQKYM